MAGMTARLDVLCAGYAADRVASTVVLIRDQGAADAGTDRARTRRAVPASGLTGPMGTH
jgi:hypothetical protein